MKVYNYPYVSEVKQKIFSANLVACGNNNSTEIVHVLWGTDSNPIKGLPWVSLEWKTFRLGKSLAEHDMLPDAALLALIRFVEKSQFFAKLTFTYHMCFTTLLLFLSQTTKFIEAEWISKKYIASCTL